MNRLRAADFCPAGSGLLPGKDFIMKKHGTSFYVLIVVAALALLCIIWGVSSYNNLVTLSTNVQQKSSDIDTALQRRNDLIPNLVATVKAYASHETEAIKLVTDARAKLAGATTSADKSAASDQLSGALSRLLVVAENYPNLKADENFQNLADEIAGTENRIRVARNDYNDAVSTYNAKIRTFPTVLIANLGGFHSADFFKASASASSVPDVNSMLSSQS